MGLPLYGGCNYGGGFQEVETYVSYLQNIFAKYIATRPIKELYLAAKQRPGPRVEMRWWEQEGLDLEGIWKVAQEADQMEEAKETDGTKTAIYD